MSLAKPGCVPAFGRASNRIGCVSSKERETDWLSDIVENVRAAENYVGGLTFDKWKEQMRIDALERCLMRLTEAPIHIGEASKTECSKLPTRSMDNSSKMLSTIK
jgi:uncharacterized protein with HEPN domain